MKVKKLLLKNIRFLLIIVFVIFTLESCSNKTTNNMSNLVNFKKDFKTLSINTDIEINSPDNNFNFNVDFKFYQRDTLNSTINGPFGITLAKLFTTSDTMYVYSIMDNKVYVGTPKEENLKKSLNISLSFKDIMNILLTDIPNQIEEYIFYQKNIEGNNVLKRVDKDKGVEFLVIDKDNFTLKQYQYKSTDGETKLNVFYNDFKVVDNMNFANDLEIQLPQQNSRIKFKFNEILSNPMFDTPLMFKMPKNAVVINLNQM